MQKTDTETEPKTLADTIRAANEGQTPKAKTIKAKLLQMTIDTVLFFVILGICYLAKDASIFLIIIMITSLCFIRDKYWLAYIAFIAALLLITHGFVINAGRFSVSWDTT